MTALLVAVLAAGAVTSFFTVSWADTQPVVTCSDQTVPVTLSPTDATVYHVLGQLCVVEDLNRGAQTVELLVSGMTYDHTYFDVAPLGSNSYAFNTHSRGYSTFAIDRLGNGLSDHPPAEKLTVQSHAYVIGQIVQKLRAGAIDSHPFANVVGVGHSFGTAILEYLAGTATDASTVPNYLILGSFLNTSYAPGTTALANAIYPASSDPKFASSGYGADYITTLPGTRGSIFYNTASADPALIAADETNKQTGTVSERASIPAARDRNVLAAIKVPALITVGQYDNLYCNETAGLSCATSAAIMTRESQNYSARACLSAYVVADAGHTVAGHLRAQDSYTATDNWLDKYTVTGINSKDANGCLP
jgi:pimeloyl-ACP methyl ester carboxylesterase